VAFPSYQQAGSIAFNAPTAGFVSLTGVATFYWRNVSACTPACRVAARLREATSGAVSLHILGSFAGDGAGATSLTPHWVFQVPAGPRTYFLDVAYIPAFSGSGSLGIFNTAINVVFTPNGSMMSVGEASTGTSSSP
jgi:hypothetical protein